MCGVAEAQLALAVVTTVAGFQNKSAVHKRNTAANEVSMRNADHAYLADLSKIEPGLLTKIINGNNNTNGEVVKVLLATSRAKEGLDLKKVSQINIMEPWYNLSRIEQIIGRAVRNCSHKLLDFVDRNVEIYMHCAYYVEEKTIENEEWSMQGECQIELNKYMYIYS